MTQPQPDEDPFVKEVRRQANLAKNAHHTSFWKSLSTVGAIGWMISLPAVCGAFVGRWIDGRYGTGISWTLSFLTIGLFLGCVTAWRHINRETKE